MYIDLRYFFQTGIDDSNMFCSLRLEDTYAATHMKIRPPLHVCLNKAALRWGMVEALEFPLLKHTETVNSCLIMAVLDIQLIGIFYKVTLSTKLFNIFNESQQHEQQFRVRCQWRKISLGNVRKIMISSTYIHMEGYLSQVIGQGHRSEIMVTRSK